MLTTAAVPKPVTLVLGMFGMSDTSMVCPAVTRPLASTVTFV